MKYKSIILNTLIAGVVVFGCTQLGLGVYQATVVLPAENQHDIDILNAKLDTLLKEHPQTPGTVVKETTIIKQIQYGVKHPKVHVLQQWLGNKLKK